jgi:hypothetical protein
MGGSLNAFDSRSVPGVYLIVLVVQVVHTVILRLITGDPNFHVCIPKCVNEFGFPAWRGGLQPLYGCSSLNFDFQCGEQCIWYADCSNRPQYHWPFSLLVVKSLLVQINFLGSIFRLMWGSLGSMPGLGVYFVLISRTSNNPALRYWYNSYPGIPFHLFDSLHGLQFTLLYRLIKSYKVHCCSSLVIWTLFSKLYCSNVILKNFESGPLNFEFRHGVIVYFLCRLSKL